LNAALSALIPLGLLGLGSLYFLGLGWLVVGPLLHAGPTTRRGDSALLGEIPLALTTGMISNYGLVLALESLRSALTLGGVLSLVGLVLFVGSMIHGHGSSRLSRTALVRLIGASFFSLVFLSPILTEPLSAWDARSIWFFHAKMIYAAGSMGLSAGWQDPSVVFAHPNYPNLVPVMAAQVATLVGYWNEYLPKAALLFMLVPAVLWLFSFARRSLSFLALLLLLPLALSSPDPPDGLHAWLWNGYMDGYLALFFAIAVLLLGRYRETSEPVDMASAVCILISLPNLKNEGAVIALAALPLVAWLVYASHRFRMAALVHPANLKYYVAAMAGSLPAALWGIRQLQWNLGSAMAAGPTAQALTRMTDRLLDGSLLLILQHFWTSCQGAVLLLGVLCTAYVAWSISLPRGASPPLLAAAIYGLGIIVIYLLTPLPLAWQLDTSMQRLALSVNGCLFAAAYYMLKALEPDPALRAPREPALD
jgi:hypothetical protein